MRGVVLPCVCGTFCLIPETCRRFVAPCSTGSAIQKFLRTSNSVPAELPRSAFATSREFCRTHTEKTAIRGYRARGGDVRARCLLMHFVRVHGETSWQGKAFISGGSKIPTRILQESLRVPCVSPSMWTLALTTLLHRQHCTADCCSVFDREVWM